MKNNFEHNCRRINEKGIKGQWRCIECGAVGDFKHLYTIPCKCKNDRTFENRIIEILEED
jgi:hypothetical protein